MTHFVYMNTQKWLVLKKREIVEKVEIISTFQRNRHFRKVSVNKTFTHVQEQKKRFRSDIPLAFRPAFITFHLHSVKLPLFKLNITFYFKCYLHLNCSINLNWNNTQLYSSVKPLCNVPSSVFWFIIFCFLPFLRRTSVQKWKENWFCYVRKWIDQKEMSVKISNSIASAKILQCEGSISPLSF